MNFMQLIRDNPPILVASQLGGFQTVKILLEDSTIHPFVLDCCLRIATMKGHLGIVKLFLKDPRTTLQKNIITFACVKDSSKNHLKIVKLFLRDNRSDPSYKNSQCLRRACVYGHSEVVRLLLQDNRVDPSAKNSQAIKNACKNGHSEVVRLLLQDNRVDPSASDDYTTGSISRYAYLDKIKFMPDEVRQNILYGNNMAMRYACRNYACLKGYHSDRGCSLMCSPKGKYPSDYLKIVKILHGDKRVDISEAIQDAEGEVKEFLLFEMYKVKIFLLKNIQIDMLEEIIVYIIDLMII